MWTCLLKNVIYCYDIHDIYQYYLIYLKCLTLVFIIPRVLV